MSTLELEHIKHTSSSSNNLSTHSDGSLTVGNLQSLNVLGNVGIGTSSPSASHRLTLDKTSNYGGISLNQNGNQVGQIIQEGGTGNIYVDADSNNVGGGLIFRTAGGTTRMTIDTLGRVTMSNQPKFFSYLSGRFPSSGDIPSNSIIPFDSTNQNVGSGFDTSNYRYTAPVSGAYVFGMNVRLVNNNGIRVARAMIRKNGSQMWDLAFVGGSKSPNASDHPSLSGVTIINANANDYFDLQISSELSYAGHLYADPGLRSNFWGYLLG